MRRAADSQPGALSAQIASSRALSSGRHAGSLGDAGITGERIPGLRIERCCPAQTVVLLELTEGPLRLGTQDAIKRPFVESPIAKFDLRPANVIFPEASPVSKLSDVWAAGGMVAGFTGLPVSAA